MPDLNCIPPDQHDQAWALLRGMVIAVIDEVKKEVKETFTSHVSQHGGVSLSPRGVAAGAGVGDGQEDALGVIFF